MKFCPDCKTEKDESEFAKRTQSNDGLKHNCKLCQKKYDKERNKRIKITQKPIVSVVGRNANEISKFVKLFFSKYPQYNWITFDPMLTKSKPPQTMRRVDFAKRLQGNFAAVWIDRIASFGTFPLECMKSGTIPICLKPDIMPEYMIERDEKGVGTKVVNGAGIWTDNDYDLPVLTGEVLIKFLDDNISPELYESMEKIASKYNQDASEKRLTELYQEFIDQRIGLLQNVLQPVQVIPTPTAVPSQRTI